MDPILEPASPIAPPSGQIGTLTPEQQKYINHWQFSIIILGPLYFWINGMVKEGFFLIIPFYNIYIFFKAIIYGRRMVWAKGTWGSFENFRKRQRIVALTAGILIAVYIVFFGIAGIIGYETLKGPSQAAKTFAADLTARNVDKVYNVDGGTVFRDIGTEDQFKGYLDQNHALGATSFSFDSYNRVNGTAKVEGSFVDTQGTTQAISIDLDKENGAWKVAGVTFGEGDSSADTSQSSATDTAQDPSSATSQDVSQN